MKKSYKIAAVILALIMLFSVVTVTSFAKSSFSKEVEQVSSLVDSQKCFGRITTDTDSYATETDYATNTDCGTKTDVGSFFCRIFTKISNFFRWIFSWIGLS